MKDTRLLDDAVTKDHLFRRFLAGEAAAVACVEGLVTRVVRFRGYYIPRGELPDVVQQVLLDVWGTVSGSGFCISKDFEALIRSIAYRVCVDWMRRRRPAVPIDEAAIDPARPPDLELLAKEQSALGREVVQELRAPCRELFRLYVGEGMSYRRIGEIQERSEGALKTQMYECLKEAREILRRRRAARLPAGGGEGRPR